MIAKSCLDAIVVEDSQGKRRFPDSTYADESKRIEIFGKANDPRNQIIAPKKDARGWGRQFPRRDATRM